MKQGEAEAKRILSEIGIEFDDFHVDNNIGRSIPDLKYKNGRYLEVTHTQHNNKAVGRVPDIVKNKSIHEQYEEAIRVDDAYQRLKNRNYTNDTNGKNQFKHDIKLVKRSYGYDLTKSDYNELHSEFGCDFPSFYFTTDHILDRVQTKGEKYPDGNTDLFLFVADAEFNLMVSLLKQYDVNGATVAFINRLFDSPFNTIFIATWDFYGQTYYEKPTLVKFYKNNKGLDFKYLIG